MIAWRCSDKKGWIESLLGAQHNERVKTWQGHTASSCRRILSYRCSNPSLGSRYAKELTALRWRAFPLLLFLTCLFFFFSHTLILTHPSNPGPDHSAFNSIEITRLSSWIVQCEFQRVTFGFWNGLVNLPLRYAYVYPFQPFHYLSQGCYCQWKPGKQETVMCLEVKKFCKKTGFNREMYESDSKIWPQNVELFKICYEICKRNYKLNQNFRHIVNFTWIEPEMF